MLVAAAKHLIARLRRPVPTDGHVVPGSTPVLSFGDATKASVATIGLNPSRKEFLDDNGRELNEGSRRLETMKSLGVSDLATAPDPILFRIVQGCNNYFAVNPYKWFRELEPILEGVNASYQNGSACHLDLIQWATDPVWSKISDKAVQAKLLQQDVPFLREQLMAGAFKLVLLNGAGVTKQFESAFRILNFNEWGG